MIADQENSNVKFLRSTVGLNPRESEFIRGKKPLLFSVTPWWIWRSILEWSRRGVSSELPSLSPAEDLHLGPAGAYRCGHGGLSFH